MRKISPTDVQDDFLKQLVELSRFHNACMTALATASDHSRLNEHSLLAAAVAWEGFVSDMLIAYINRDATRFKKHLKDSFETHVNSATTPSQVYGSFASLSFPRHLTKENVQRLANSGGNNITFPNFAELEVGAGKLLAADHAAKFIALSAQQKAVVNAVIALRNHVAHRSRRSSEAMNTALNQGALHHSGIKRGPNKFHDVGAWLKAVPPGRADTRLDTIINVLTTIGTAF